MIQYQVQPYEQDPAKDVKQLLQDSHDYDKFFSKIENVSYKDRTYHVSYAQIVTSFITSIKCFLVIQVNQKGQAEIGYARQAIPNSFPLNSGPPIMQIKTPLKYLKNFQLITKKNQLTINFYDSIKNKNEVRQFKFKDDPLFNQWIELIIDLNSKNDTQDLKQEERKKNNDLLKEQNNQLQERLELVKKERKMFNDKLQQEQSKNKAWLAQDIETKKQKAQLMLAISQGKQKYQKSQTEYKVRLERQCKSNLEKDKKITELEQQLLQNKVQIEQLKSKLKIANDTLAYEKDVSVAKNIQNQNALTAKSQQIEKLQACLAQQREKQQQLKHINEAQIQALKTQSLEKSNLIKNLQQEHEILSLFPFFNGCLNQYQQEKIFLKESIQRFTVKHIESTKKLFEFDSANKTGFHHYFDNRQNAVLIFKTVTGSIVAAFSQSPLNERQASGNAAILSLTYKYMFPLMEGRRAVSYDEYYIIFGSSQINIKGGELKVFSNFGCSSRCYDSKGHSTQILLGQKRKQIQLEWYQIHQIHFVQ